MRMTSLVFILSVMTGGVPILGVSVGGQVNAQMAVDETLPSNSRVVSEGSNFIIDGGTQVEGNLFHSFEFFSIPSGASALFRSNSTLKNIFSRVTGDFPSELDGLLQVEGTANIFLLNPNGIFFGPDASLNIGGAFVATTAEKIKFGDGHVWGSSQGTDDSTLSIDVPVGLQFGNAVGKISNSSNYRDATTAGQGLSVGEHASLNLIGGPIEFNQGVIDSPGSLIELVSVGSNSVINLAWRGSKYTVERESINLLDDIEILGISSILSKGNSSGLIRLIGDNILVTGGSQIVSQTSGSEADLGIEIDAKGDFRISGTAPLTGPFDAGLEVLGIKVPRRSKVSSDLSVLSTQVGGDISVRASKVIISDGAELSVTVGGSGIGGRIFVQSSDLIEIAGNAPLLGVDSKKIQDFVGSIPVNPVFFARGFTASLLSSTSLGTGQSKDLIVNTKNLIIHNGGIINAGPLGPGPAGNVEITATNLVEVHGTDLTESYPSAINVGALRNASGVPGNLRISTPVLKIREGARIGLDTTRNEGALGIINAGKLVEISGSSLNGKFQSRISGQSSVSGIGGTVNLTTQRLHVLDSGSIFVAGVSASQGGDIQVVADSILLDNNAEISTSSAQLLGGNINLQVKDALLMRRSSKISAQAGETGTGGNIFITADLVAAPALDNNDIIANAISGPGGKIELTAQAILGLEVRERLTSKSDISASSEVGIDGTVTINSPDVDLDTTPVELSKDLSPPALEQNCQAEQLAKNKFFVTGRGGLSETPVALTAAGDLWQDLEPLDENHGFVGEQLFQANTTSVSFGIQQSLRKSTPLTEAKSWSVNHKGKIQLMALDSSSVPLSLEIEPRCTANLP